MEPNATGQLDTAFARELRTLPEASLASRRASVVLVAAQNAMSDERKPWNVRLRLRVERSAIGVALAAVMSVYLHWAFTAAMSLRP